MCDLECGWEGDGPGREPGGEGDWEGEWCFVFVAFHLQSLSMVFQFRVARWECLASADCYLFVIYWCRHFPLKVGFSSPILLRRDVYGRGGREGGREREREDGGYVEGKAMLLLSNLSLPSFDGEHAINGVEGERSNTKSEGDCGVFYSYSNYNRASLLR